MATELEQVKQHFDTVLKYELKSVHQEIAQMKGDIKELKEANEKKADTSKWWISLVLSGVVFPLVVAILLAIMLAQGG